MNLKISMQFIQLDWNFAMLAHSTLWPGFFLDTVYKRPEEMQKTKHYDVCC